MDKSEEVRRKFLELSDLLIKYGLNEINRDLKTLTKVNEDFFGKSFLNEAM